MYLLNVSYIQPIEEVVKHQETHSVWVKKYISEGIFLIAGPKKSKMGGAILVKSIDKQRLNNILAEDSFIEHDMAEYQIIDFDCKLSVDDLGMLKTA